MLGDPDPQHVHEYVRARRALLDAADAIVPHLDSVVLVGAQAVYLHVGEADLFDAAAPYTIDADLAIRPAGLADSPLLSDRLTGRGFTFPKHPGGWVSPDGVRVDLMVPEALAGPGSRGARLGPHGKRVARRAKGLEAALVDRGPFEIHALDPSDGRCVTMHVAGPAALIVAKVHKIAERASAPDRLSDKDALDVLRLLQATDTSYLAQRLDQLRTHELSAAVTAEAIGHLEPLFGTAEATGVTMAVRAAGPTAATDTLVASLTILVSDLLSAL